MIQSWFHLKLCLIRKIVALNVFLYSKLWYAAHITPFTHAFEKAIREIIRRFLLGKDNSPISYKLLTRKPQARGLRLIDAARHCR